MKEKLHLLTRTNSEGYYLFEKINMNSLVSITTSFQRKNYWPNDIKWIKLGKNEIELDICIP